MTNIEKSGINILIDDQSVNGRKRFLNPVDYEYFVTSRLGGSLLIFSNIQTKKQVRLDISGITIAGEVPTSEADTLEKIKALCASFDLGDDTGGSAVIDITHADLVVAINDGTLVAGAKYRVTDFQTVHFIIDTNGNQYTDSIITGPNEVLLVEAASENTLKAEAYSELYPQDVLRYDPLPDRWTSDLSFADQNTNEIVSGFKGVIYFRHDLKNDNSFGYDFRHVKFRRWKHNVAAYNPATPYANGAYALSGDVIYKALRDNDAGTDVSNDRLWVALMGVDQTPYVCSFTGHRIPAHPTDHIDVHTFAEMGTDTYEDTVFNNHVGGFKDNFDFWDSAATLLGNNVFYLFNAGYFTFYKNSFGAGTTGNTFLNSAFQNTIGANFTNNLLDKNFGNNIIGNNVTNNIIGFNCQSNTIGAASSNNYCGRAFVHNEIASLFNNNFIAENFNGNKVDPYFMGNRFAGLQNCRFGSSVSSCVITDYANNIDFHQSVNSINLTTTGAMVQDQYYSKSIYQSYDVAHIAYIHKTTHTWVIAALTSAI